MDTRRSYPAFVSICFCFIGVVFIGLFVTACGGSTSPPQVATPFSPPTSTPEQPTATPITILPAVPTSTPICTDNLTFISDVTIPDGTVVAPGSILDKQWLVQNSGDCNWDASYQLRLISGNALGASTDQALYPARAGTQATVRILFITPQEAGEYISEWQAFDANGIAFGESFFIKIEVQQ
ncbi:MAG: NBR1-Ig-like domain-containing protein [Anaerolineales bacterium]|jgi:hypothetical protein